MSSFAPKFSDYQVVVLDYEGFEFAPPVKQAFVDYINSGGGLVVLHAADNAFPARPECNAMIGVGGWGGFTPGCSNRTEAFGPKIRWRDAKMVLDSETPGTAQHPPPHDFLTTGRAPDHPIMRGLPPAWLHANDEIYSNLRGPARHETVLATAMAPTTMQNGTGENEPILMAIAYGKGRIFHNTLGHVGAAQKGTDSGDELRRLRRAPPARHRVGGDRQGHNRSPGRCSDRGEDIGSLAARGETRRAARQRS